MNVLLVVLLVLMVLLSAMLVWMLVQMHQRIATIHARLEPLPVLPAAAAGRSVIAIEILNPLELALRENSMAGVASKLAPRMLERMVYTRAAGQIADQLKAQGVQAQVTAHVA